MEFKEFTNPLEADYDITSSLKEENTINSSPNDDYYEELSEAMGYNILEDDDFLTIEEDYGITQEEYFNPTPEVIEKVKKHLGCKRS